ncbi:MAG: biotin--[acetyl-CoA-carboxylase] ligase [Saprospiraceae bacterium]
MNIPKIYLYNKYKVIHFEEIDSTNEYAWNLISNNNPNENAVIIADNQTHGKGQYGRNWETQQGKNITMTAIVKPYRLHIKDAFHLNIIVSVAIINILEKEMDTKLKVKWPNDIYYNNNKLCGILIKNKVVDNKIKSSIIGIGINVNQESFDTHLLNPISMTMIKKRVFDKNQLALKVLDEIYSLFAKRKKESVTTLCKIYNTQLYRSGEMKKYIINGKNRTMIIEKVDASGILYLRDGEGEIIEISSGIEYVKDFD